MEPTEKRISAVREFVRDTEPDLDYDVVAITDGFGPSTVKSELTAIVASRETARGAAAVNRERLKSGLSILSSYLIDLVGEDEAEEAKWEGVGVKEGKISSSNQRQLLLGTLLKPAKSSSRRWGATGPYVVGLTGGIASGKSHASQYLQSLGAVVVDCDRLGHQAYLKGSDCFHKSALLSRIAVPFCPNSRIVCHLPDWWKNSESR